MTGTRYIRAVLVTDGRSSRLPAVLAAVNASQLAPSAIHLVVLADADLPEIPDAWANAVSRYGARTYAAALEAVLEEFPAEADDELLWLLHDDTAPAPDTLGKLEATARKRPRAAVVGATHVRWDDASRLVNLGTTVSRWGGRRIGLAADDDINQGQYDARDDVLAVSLAAALVSRSAWEALGGIDTGYRGFGESIDFCRRAWTSGRDVVIVPSAKVRHSQEALYDRRGGSGLKRGTHAQRRVGEWYHAFAWAPWWSVVLLALAVIPSALGRALMRIMQNHPGLVGAELAVPLLVLGRAGAIAATRRSIARTASKRGTERGLLANNRRVFTHVRERELGGWEQWRAERTPSDVERAELSSRRTRTRLWGAGTAAVALLVSLALGARWLAGVLAGQMLTGDGVGITDVAFTDLWARASSGWSEAGLGVPALDGAFAALLSGLAIVWGDLRVTLAVALVLAPFLAVGGAWFAAGAATRAPWARAGLALLYGLWPLFVGSVLDVRVGAVIAHVMLPWVAWGLARSVGWRKGEMLGDGREYPAVRRQSASAGLLAAVALAVVTTAAPALLLPSVIALGVVGAIAGPLRWRVWSIPLLSLVIGAPGLVAAALHLGDAASVLLREPGPSAPFSGLDPLGLLTGTDGSGRWAEIFHVATPLAYVPGTVVLLAGIAAFVLTRSRAVATAICIAALGLATAAFTQATVAAFPDDAGNVAVRGWPGAGSSLAALALLAAIGVAIGGLPPVREGKSRVVAGLARGGATVGIVAVLAAGVFLAWPSASRGAGQLGSPSVLPLAVPLEFDGDTRQRAAVLTTDADGAYLYTILTSDGTDLISGRAFADSEGAPLARSGYAGEGVDALSLALGTLAAGGTAASEDLAAWGVGLVVIAPDQTRLKAAFDSNPELSLVGGSERGTTYRIDRSLSTTPVSRAWLETTEGISVVPSSYGEGALELESAVGGVLTLAVPADSAWKASLDGVDLEPTTDELGRMAFAVPSGGGTLSYEYRDTSHRLWWWASIGAMAWALLGAIPLGARGLRERS